MKAQTQTSRNLLRAEVERGYKIAEPMTCTPTVAAVEPVRDTLDDDCVTPELAASVARAIVEESEADHTPGPWCAIGDAIFQDHTPTANLSSDSISRISTVFRHGRDESDPLDLLKPLTTKQREISANARLIARAPELLADNAKFRTCLENLLAATVANYLPGIPELEDAQHAAHSALTEKGGAA